MPATPDQETAAQRVYDAVNELDDAVKAAIKKGLTIILDDGKSQHVQPGKLNALVWLVE